MGEPNSISDLLKGREKVITYTPITYNADTDFTQINNVLLVDSNVQDYQKFVDNCNSSTFPITFSSSSKGQDIVDLLAAKLPTITRIAIVANNSLMSNTSTSKQLFSHKPYFLSSDLVEGVTSYSENVQLLIDLIKAHSVKNIDFLACYSLTYDNWKGYYSVLAKETGVVVGASNDETGNLAYGGDWTMESTNVDIEAMYFTSGVSGYQGTLVVFLIDFDCTLYMNGANVAYSRDGDNEDIDWVSGPGCELKGNITVTIGQDLIFDSVDNYFVVTDDAGNNVTLNGAGYKITINNVADYPGLVFSRSNNTVVTNIGVVPNTGTTTTTLARDGGWIGGNTFKGTISSCYSTGNISGNSGGIVGGNAGINGNCTITNCYSTGNISYTGGGIAGAYAGDGGSCTIENCYSTGNISRESGGIAGYLAGGSCTIENCYSTGNITGDSGGIAGAYAGDGGSCTIENCYSTGNISDNSGGIVGSYDGVETEYYGNCTITNCYSSGTVDATSGGIAGSYAGDSEPFSTRICTLNNCYVTGTNTNTNKYFGANKGSDASTPTNNCGNSSGWVDATAIQYLTGSTTTWKAIYLNNPWKLSIFLKDVSTDPYTSGTLVYTNTFPISAYPNALTVKLINSLVNGGQPYGSAGVTLTQTSVTLTGVSGIDNGERTYLVLYNGSTLVDYSNYFIKGTTSTTTLPPTTLPPTTLPPTSFANVQFSINALYSLVSTEPEMSEYKVNLATRAAFYSGARLEDITISSVTSGSIVNQIRLPTINVPALQYAIQNGLFEITIDGVTYSAIPGSFIILDNICFHKGTMILTPSGYKAIEGLKGSDLVKTAQGRIVRIKEVTSFIGKLDKCPLYVLQKGSLGINKPIMDLYMSEGHAYRNNGHWCHMKCSSGTTKLEEDNIQYYNIVLENYLEHTLVANGVEVESLFKMPGLEMRWNCGTDNCKPVITRKN